MITFWEMIEQYVQLSTISNPSQKQERVRNGLYKKLSTYPKDTVLKQAVWKMINEFYPPSDSDSQNTSIH